MSFRNFKIGTRMMMGFLIILLLMVVVALTAYSRLSNVNNEVRTSVRDTVTYNSVAEKLLRLVQLSSANRAASLRAITKEDQQYYDELAKKDNATVSDIFNYAQKVAKESETTEVERARLIRLLFEARDQYSKVRDNLIERQKNGESNESLRAGIAAEFVPATNQYMQSLINLNDYYSQRVDQSTDSVQSNFESGTAITFSILVVALIIGFVVALLLTKSITKPIQNAVDVANAISQGNLITHSETQFNKDETGLLLLALKNMQDRLSTTVSQIRHGAQTISTASTEIASGNIDLSSRTEQQASSLEETASSMEELTSTVKQNADNASQARVLSEQATLAADKGSQVISNVMATMSSITTSSNKMEDIINVIDGIAFQTNILALNAAVEAARAGEEGRGFAVVATEVRNLAQRSASAAKEIKALIDTTVEHVKQGSDLVSNAGSTMSEISEKTKRTSDMIVEISAASKEQSEGIDQVSQAVMQLDQVTQQNAALVEQAAAASESMKDQAQKLAQVVSIFKLDANDLINTIDYQNQKKPLKNINAVAAQHELTTY